MICLTNHTSQPFFGQLLKYEEPSSSSLPSMNYWTCGILACLYMKRWSEAYIPTSVHNYLATKESITGFIGFHV